MSDIRTLYTVVDNVKVLLANKVQFQADPDSLIDGELPNALLIQLIARAETRVEMDLSNRYAVPFRSKTKGVYWNLPDHSRRAIQTAVDLRAVIEILMTDFGRGSSVNGENYYKNAKTTYDEQIDLLLGRNPEAANSKRDRFRFTPPLEDLLLAKTNQEADDGYKGMVINTDGSRNDAVTYAGEQINNPAANYLNRIPIIGNFEG